MSGEVEEYPTFAKTFYPVVFYLDAANCKERLLRFAKGIQTSSGRA